MSNDSLPPQSSSKQLLNLEEPEGQVPLDSKFYIERFPIEADCYQTITKSGALIRVKAPRQMVKVLYYLELLIMQINKDIEPPT